MNKIFRTLCRRFLVIVSVCLVALSVSNFPAFAESQPVQVADSDLYAKSACLLDGESGRVLFGKEETVPMPNASTTKIMTCILALEQGDLTAVVTASQKAASQPKVHLGVREGDQFLLEDLLYSLMLESHNDSAVMVAEAIAGSTEAFAEMMNEKAEEIGCTDTHFVSPNGLDWEDEQGAHQTTARDLARIMKYCTMESQQKGMFREITGTPSYTFWDVQKKNNYNCVNHNAFLTMMDGAFSGKTGFTSKAGYCYVGALEQDGKTFIVAILACGWPNNKNYKWADTKKLMLYGLDNYEYRDVFDSSFGNPEIPVLHGQYHGTLGKNSAVTKLAVSVPPNEQELKLLLKADETVKVKYDLPSRLKAPVKAGEQVGKISYFLNEECIAEYGVCTLSEVREIDFTWCIRKILERYFCKNAVI